ncbi:MAG TPA: anthranilate phosphoribosyltransferase, partial [Erythrobacter sp.]|nr:anthranilate phosphoribosyltransferase [Erythrobacter sp.]
MKQLPDATRHLAEAEAEEVFGWILDGEADDDAIARFLVDMSA